MSRMSLTITLLLVAPFAAGVPPSSSMAAPGSPYAARYLVRPNPLPATNGIRLDHNGQLVVVQNLFNRVGRLDLHDGSLVRCPAGADAAPLKFPDDVAIDQDGKLYFTEPFERAVTRLDSGCTNPQVVAQGITDGRTFPNGIAFRGDRLFVTDMNFIPDHPSGIWEVDLNGGPARPVVRGIPTPNAFDFGPDGKAYVPSMWDGISGDGSTGSIYVVDVDAALPTATLFAGGFGVLTALKVDPQGRLVVTESDTGKVWRVDRLSKERTLLAQGAPGLDNLEIDDDGTIYVSYFVSGNIGRVNEAAGTIKLILREAPLSLPVSLNEAPDGSLLVGDVGSIVRVTAKGDATRLYRPLLDAQLLVSPAAAQIGADVYFTEFLPPRKARICQLTRDPESGRPRCTEIAATGLVSPWHLRHIRVAEHDYLLVADPGTGTLVQIDPQTGASTPVATGLSGATGLAYDPATDAIYVSESGEGRVRAIERDTGLPIRMFKELDGPQGVALDEQGLLVVEATAGKLVRIDLDSGVRTVVATGLPTRIKGVMSPFFVYTSDVLVRSNGNIVISGDADGSLIELVKQ